MWRVGEGGGGLLQEEAARRRLSNWERGEVQGSRELLQRDRAAQEGLRRPPLTRHQTGRSLLRLEP